MPVEVEKPYLSVVVTTRNDDHGGSQISRTQTFFNALVAQCNRHRIPTELIFVEWNPPADRPPLADALRWPENREFCQVRILRVPPSIHARYQYGEALPLYQMIAKNAGIRRARGEYVLATNIDILFSDDLMRHIAVRRLEKNRMYRIDRTDVGADVPVDAPIDEQLDYCRQNIIRVNKRGETVSVTVEGPRRPEENDIVEAGGGILLGEGWYPLEEMDGRPFRWMQLEGEVIVRTGDGDGNIERQQLLVDAEPGEQTITSTWTLQLRDEQGVVLGEGSLEGMTRLVFEVPIRSGARNIFRLVQVDADLTLVSPFPDDTRYMGLRVFRCGWHDGGPVPAANDTFHYARAPRSFFRRILDQVTGNRWPYEHPAIEIPSAVFHDVLPASYHSDHPQAVVVHNRRLSSRLGMLFGPGCHPREKWDGVLFFWCETEAHLIVRRPRGCTGDLCVLVETGPALGYEPFTMEVFDGSGALLVRHAVKQRSWIRLPISPDEGRSRQLIFRAAGDGKPVLIPQDPRSLAFRVLDYGWDNQLGMICQTIQSIPRRGTVKLGWGWAGQSENGDLVALNGAELIAQPTGEEGARLRIELDQEPNSGRLELRDTAGNVLSEFTAGGTHWDLPADSEDSPIHLYQLFSSGVETGRPIARIRGMHWLPGIKRRQPRLPLLHTNACGDFTMLHRDHWHDLRGYAEFDLYSMNLDSLFCFAAYHAGIEEDVWADPMRIYHIEHGAGSGWTPEGQAGLYSRLAKRGVEWMDWAQVVAFALQMNRLRCPMIFCGPDWGLGGDSLEEVLR